MVEVRIQTDDENLEKLLTYFSKEFSHLCFERKKSLAQRLVAFLDLCDPFSHHLSEFSSSSSRVEVGGIRAPSFEREDIGALPPQETHSSPGEGTT